MPMHERQKDLRDHPQRVETQARCRERVLSDPDVLRPPCHRPFCRQAPGAKVPHPYHPLRHPDVFTQTQVDIKLLVISRF